MGADQAGNRGALPDAPQGTTADAAAVDASPKRTENHMTNWSEIAHYGRALGSAAEVAS